MALVVKDRVQETTTTSGTGTLTLAGAIPGFQTFSTAIGNGNTTFYTIYDNVAQEWEVGIGTVGAGTLARTTVLSNSSGTTTQLSLAGNASSVFCTYPAEKSVNVDAYGNVNILTNVPNTLSTVGTLNVGDGTYNFSQLGQLATFASDEPVVNTVSIQNTSTSNTAYSSVQLGANNYNTGYFLELGTNSSTYSYAAAGYPNSSINQPNTNYILANKADLGIATWDADDIHFIQNASTVATDSMTLYYDGGVSLGGLPSPGIGNIACNNINLKFQQIPTTGGTTTLNNASPYYTQFTGTSAEDLVLPDATTCLVGTTLIFDNDSTQNITIKDGAGTTFELLVPGGFHTFVLEDNTTIAGTWLRYSQVPSTVEWGTYSLSLGATTITGGVWNGGTIPTGYGGTGLTGFAAANNALYSTSSSALVAGTLPIAAGGTAVTSFTANGVVYGNGTSALGVTAAGTTGQVLVGNTGSAPTWGTLSGAAVTSFQTSLSGLTPSTATTGAVTLAGTLGVASGGTGATTLTGYLSGNGTSAITASTTIPGSAISGNISGDAANVTGTVAIANGGTGQTTANAAFNALVPSQSTNSGKFLTTDGTNSSWGTPTAAANADGVIWENNTTITSNYTLTTSKNGFSVGPIIINPGVSVTVPTGQRWVVL